MAKITREAFEKKLIDLINPDVFDNAAERGVPSAKEYQVPIHQRFPNWSRLASERLVDSVMNDLPMSNLLMTQGVVLCNGEHFTINFVQDGQTRLSILQDYLKNKFAWNDKLYNQLSEMERAHFNNYTVRVELIKKKAGVSAEEFKNVCRLIFGRINSGKPLTDNDKFHNCMDQPVLQLVMEIKMDPEFRAPIKKIFGDIGGGKSRLSLANMVGVILALALEDSDCITPSYLNNSQHVISDNGSAVVITEAIKERVRAFFRWYIALVDEIKETTKVPIKKGLYKKISGFLALTLTDWLDGMANERRDMWIDYIQQVNQLKNYETRIYKNLAKGVLANNSATNFRKRIECILLAFVKRIGADGEEEEEETPLAEDDDEYESSTEDND
jgi:hypothetical protein